MFCLLLSGCSKEEVLEKYNANEYIINSISCVCTALEERYGFRENFYSIEGHNLFFDYIKETYCSLLENVSSVELIGKSAQDIRLLKLQRAEQKYPYAYMVSKLNFYLNYYCMAKEADMILSEFILLGIGGKELSEENTGSYL